MARIHQLINEINELKNELSHRTGIQIHKILEGNQKLFLEHIDKDSFTPIFNSFERLADANAREFMSPDYKREFQLSADLLSFYLNRVI